jgi:hypothetical protein
MPYGINLPHHQVYLVRCAASCLSGCFVHHLFFAWSRGHQKHGMDKRRLGSVGLASRVNLRAEVGSSRARLGEVARENGLEEGAEDDLGTTIKCQSKSESSGVSALRSLGERHPQNEDELKGVVEGEPVNGVDGALKHRQERVDDPVSQPLELY